MAQRDTEWLGEHGDRAGFEPLIREYLSWLEVHGYAERTTVAVRHTARSFARWCLERGIPRPSEVTFPALQRYQRWLYYHRTKAGKPLSVRTQAARLSQLRGWFRWLVREHHLLYNPASELDLPKVKRLLPRDVLSAREAEEVLASIDLATPQGLRNRAIVETLYSTGLRRLELVGLDVYDLDRDRLWLTVRQGKGGRDRVVPIGERAVAWIDRYAREARPGWVVAEAERALFLSYQGERLSARSLSSIVTRIVRDSGVRPRGSCHLFRHTMATLMLENGADIRYIQQILGHVKLDTTQVYTRVSIRGLQKIHAATHPAARLARRGRREEPGEHATAEELLAALAAEEGEEAEHELSDQDSQDLRSR